MISNMWTRGFRPRVHASPEPVVPVPADDPSHWWPTRHLEPVYAEVYRDYAHRLAAGTGLQIDFDPEPPAAAGGPVIGVLLAEPADRIVITREKRLPAGPGQGWTWVYRFRVGDQPECYHGPGLRSLRALLRATYGRGVPVVLDWTGKQVTT